MSERHRLWNRPYWCSAVVLAASCVLMGCSGSGAGDEEEEGSAAVSVAVMGAAAHVHADPVETCFICDPSKREAGRLWCKGHGRYEDRCWPCHPELEDKDRIYCNEHGLYEDECFLCHPELESGVEAAAGSLGGASAGELFCNEHGVAEKECGICHPELAAGLRPGDNLKVRLLSVVSAGKAGVRTESPLVSRTEPAVKAFCEAGYNLNAMAKVSPLAGGIIREVRHDLGARVEEGEVLVVLHSADVASATSDYLTAIVELDIRRTTFEREERLSGLQISAEEELLSAEAAHRTARLALDNLKRRLLNLGLTEQEIGRMESEQDASADLRIRAPFAGTLVERDAVVGEAVEAGRALFTIADLSTRWLALSIPADRIDQIRLGQTVEARFPDLPGAVYTGRISWVDTSVDPRSRMVRARARVDDPAGRIKTGLFGDARILTGDARPAAIVPRGAIQRYEGHDFVFVRDEADLFSLRGISLGESKGDAVAVLAGLLPDDHVVTDGAFIVMSEFLKSRLGAGCVDH